MAIILSITSRVVFYDIGANTFLEMGFAYYAKKPIYALNPLPDYKYINDELLNFDVKVINGDLSEIRQ
ncbi:MAG: hypothetical protein Q4A79_03185 [Candidatus Saccharibacteria bacterium]|nr:hypothetical protein [Candidatus Saccharibacteria bacterium]